MRTGGKPPIAKLQKGWEAEQLAKRKQEEEQAKKKEQKEEAKGKEQERSSAAASGSTSRGPAESKNDSESDGFEEISEVEFKKTMANSRPKSQKI
ncbi:uncharacterized protein PGTG_15281 [Puccinia graminis f. sp. tritici CRL 75-36-700-3]|uniref:Uncharacterized protein n=1 Tax=Puccinia graminis f. sp. tritici (strain CRL 75-36-700-3 / race SCCL) TaxID=418459 RepID=E3KYP3_PUCGT|nr:uncharacterized protein PGTG_15281 [Puccinia graminis f. sp. tritici CRL 75-36-700-3]EFP89439.2 hypothetical protein PGTG_15281 [Puccinia graminis f. sp. tritici CRL 75-36-700-3]